MNIEFICLAVFILGLMLIFGADLVILLCDHLLSTMLVLLLLVLVFYFLYFK